MCTYVLTGCFEHVRAHQAMELMMFYCDPCKDKSGWPESSARSYGRCEICGKSRSCNDVPLSALPLPKERSASQRSVPDLSSDDRQHAVQDREELDMTDQHGELLKKLTGLRKLVDGATLGPWRSVESKDTWTLHGETRSFKGKIKGGAGPSMQILKAPKHGTQFAEYWPNAADSELIVEAVNRMPFWLDWAEDVLTRHFPVPCACNKVHPLFCSANRTTYEWASCPEVMAVVRAIEMIHNTD